jgi:ABC-type dipeptide/oligopeptide/nickel transport system ATPase component
MSQKVVAIVGPESVGKSVLAGALLDSVRSSESEGLSPYAIYASYGYVVVLGKPCVAYVTA